MPAKTDPGNAGDWLEVHSPGGGPPRRGLILEVLGASGHGIGEGQRLVGP